MVAALKLNHDVVVPKGRIPRSSSVARLPPIPLHIPSFGHAQDGNIHVNSWSMPAITDEVGQTRAAEPALFAGVIALEGSISRAPASAFEGAVPADRVVCRRDCPDAAVKAALDPNGILNPGRFSVTGLGLGLAGSKP